MVARNVTSVDRRLQAEWRLSVRQSAQQDLAAQQIRVGQQNSGARSVTIPLGTLDLKNLVGNSHLGFSFNYFIASLRAGLVRLWWVTFGVWIYRYSL